MRPRSWRPCNVRPRADNVLRFFVPLEVDVRTDFFHVPIIEQLVFAQPPGFSIGFSQYTVIVHACPVLPCFSHVFGMTHGCAWHVLQKLFWF